MSEKARGSRQRRTGCDRRLDRATDKTHGSLLEPMQTRAGPIC
jgi:hypothetical protein